MNVWPYSKVLVSGLSRWGQARTQARAVEEVCAKVEYWWGADWPDDGTARSVMPDWFVKACDDAWARPDYGRVPSAWHFPSWLDAMKDPGWTFERVFASGCVRRRVCVRVEIYRLPSSIEVLESVLWAAGLRSVRADVEFDARPEGY